jgi:predicted small integral membrane protein
MATVQHALAWTSILVVVAAVMVWRHVAPAREPRPSIASITVGTWRGESQALLYVDSSGSDQRPPGESWRR